jgi:hypothetical protein
MSDLSAVARRAEAEARRAKADLSAEAFGEGGCALHAFVFSRNDRSEFFVNTSIDERSG